MTDSNYPNIWVKAKLADVADIVGGGTPSRNNPKFFNGDILWAVPSDLTKLKSLWLYKTQESITEEGLLESSTKVLPKGTVLMTSRAVIGVTAIANYPICTNQGFANFICNKTLVCNVFLAYWLRYIKKLLIKLASGTTFKEISKTSLSKIEIPLPPLPEQRRIAAILEQADELRQLRHEADEKAEKLLPALFHEVFGEINPRKKYPEGWIQTSLSSVIIDSQYGTSTSLQDEGDVAVLRMNNITLDGWLDFSSIKYLPNKAIDWNMYSLEPGDILFNRTNSKELVGKTALWDQDEKQKFSFASYIIRIRLDQEKVLPEYIWALLNSHYGKTNLFRLAKQAVNMANINTQELGSIPIVIPPLPLQKKFSLLLKSFKEKLFLHKQSMDSIEKLFQSLLSQAFTGELTATWREKHADELAKAAQERDELLAKEQIRLTTPAKNTQDISQLTLGQHHQLYNSFLMELKSSEQQYKVYQAAISEAKYFTAETLTEKIDLLSTTFVKHSLELFEAAGLIIKVSIPSYITGETRFVSAYRALWPKDISLDDEFVDDKNYDSLDGSKIESL